MEWKGLAARLPQHSQHSWRADRRLERKESELPRAFAWASAHAAASVGKVVCAFCELPCQRVRAGVVSADDVYLLESVIFPLCGSLSRVTCAVCVQRQ